jgi:hypothetical protein
MKEKDMTTEVTTSIKIGFEDHDKNRPMFTMTGSLDELLLIAKLLSHVRLGIGSRGSIAASKLLRAIEEDIDGDIFTEAECMNLEVTVAGEFSSIAARIYCDNMTIEVSDA